MNSIFNSEKIQKKIFSLGIIGTALGLSLLGMSSSFASEISDNAGINSTREYVQSVSSSCSPEFSDITPAKYSDIGEIETLSFSLSNNVNPDSVSVRINNKNLPFSLQKTEISGKYSGIIDVSDAENGRQIVSLYAQSNDAIHCSFRDYIYVLYKNKNSEFSDTNRTKNTNKIEPFLRLSTDEVSRQEISGNPHITFPSLDSTIFTISQDGQHISGTAPKGTKKIWVDFSDEQGNTEHYFLRKFNTGDTSWKYFASSRYHNLSRGLNTYRIYAEFENGKFSDSETIILFFPPENSTDPFVDTIGHWGEKSITFLRSKGIVHGRVKNKLFFPDAPITKAETLKIATLSFNVKKQKFQKGDFVDVKASDWFADYASTAKKAELSGGGYVSEKMLNPHALATPRQAASLIMDATGRKNVLVEFSSSEVTRAEFSQEVVRLMK